MAHPIDLYVGTRIRKRRKLIGLTLEKVAGMVGVNYQQIQKYESGHHKVSPGRLFALACAMSVPVGYFFEGMPSEAIGTLTPANQQSFAVMELLSRNETSELVLAYYSLQERERKEVLEFLDCCRHAQRKQSSLFPTPSVALATLGVFFCTSRR